MTIIHIGDKLGVGANCNFNQVPKNGMPNNNADTPQIIGMNCITILTTCKQILLLL